MAPNSNSQLELELPRSGSHLTVYLYTLKEALKNKHHDEPGYWENVVT